MEENPTLRIPTISLSQTSGLTSIQQLVDATANEIFSFTGTTSEVEVTLVPFSPASPEWALEPDKRAETFLNEFKSIVKTKLKKPIDLKKLYYRQIEHTP